MKSYLLLFHFMMMAMIAFPQENPLPGTMELSDQNGQDRMITIQYGPGEKTLDREWEPFYWDDYDPGVPPEGDYLGASVFSTDGSKVYLTNRMSNTLTVFDWASMTALETVSTGSWPSCIAATDDYIIVGCQFSDQVYIYDAQDFQLIDSIPTGEQPCQVHISPDGLFAYVACDIDDVCTVIDLDAMVVSQTISGFTIYLQTVSWSTQSARNWAKYSDFLVSPDGDHLIVHNGESEVQVFDVATGLVSQTVPVTSPRALAFSGDNSYLICAANPGSIATVHRITWPGLVEDASVEVTGTALSTNEVVADQPGTKAYIGTASNTSTLVRFTSGDFLQFTSTYTAFWLGVTNDHQYAIGGQYRFSIIDFENETMTDQFQGKNQSWGAVSPVAYDVFGYDPLLYEGGHFFDISTPSDIDYRGSVLSGDAPEGDAPYRLATSNEYGYIICVNNLSYSCTIMDYLTGEIMASIGLGESCYDVVTMGQYAICGGYDMNTVKVIDLETLDLVATVTCGQRPMELTVGPGNILYAANIKSNTISVVEIDGENSHLVANIPCGVIGVYVPFYGIRSGVELDMTGQYLLVAASFDDQVKIIDTGTNQVVKSIDVGDFPLSIAFSYDDVACVTNLFDHTFSLIQVAGENSELLGTYSCNGQYPVDVEFSPMQDEFWLCNYNSGNVTRFDASDGSYKGQVNMSAYGGAWGLEFYGWEFPVYLTVGNDNYNPAVIYKDSIFELPASASYFELAELGFDEFAVATIPGPDFVSVINIDHLEGVHNLPLKNTTSINIYPNPFSGQMTISSDKIIKEISLYDFTGRKIRADFVENKDAIIEGKQLSRGIYLVDILTGDGSRVLRKVIKE